MVRTEVVEKIETHVLCSITFFPKVVLLRDNVEIYGIEPDRPYVTI